MSPFSIVDNTLTTWDSAQNIANALPIGSLNGNDVYGPFLPAGAAQTYGNARRVVLQIRKWDAIIQIAASALMALVSMTVCLIKKDNIELAARCVRKGVEYCAMGVIKLARYFFLEKRGLGYLALPFDIFGKRILSYSDATDGYDLEKRIASLVQWGFDKAGISSLARKTVDYVGNLIKTNPVPVPVLVPVAA